MSRDRESALRYRVVGDGEPVVLLADPFDDATGWARAGYVAALAGSYRLISVDLLDQGASPSSRDPDDYSAERLADDVLCVLDSERIARAHLWAYGSSGPVAYAAAVRHPERVTSLILGGFGFGSDRGPITDTDQIWMEAVASTRRIASEQLAVRLPVQRGHDSRRPRDPQALAAAIEGLMSGASPDLSEVAVPGLLYVGSRDPVAARVQHDAQELGFPLMMVPGCDGTETFLAVGMIAPLIESHLASLRELEASEPAATR